MSDEQAPPTPPVEPAEPAEPLPPRLRRTVEIVYGVEGVAGARVWQWDDRVAVGIKPNPAYAAGDLLYRVEAAVAGMREPDEVWEFGLLEE